MSRHVDDLSEAEEFILDELVEADCGLWEFRTLSILEIRPRGADEVEETEVGPGTALGTDMERLDAAKRALWTLCQRGHAALLVKDRNGGCERPVADAEVPTVIADDANWLWPVERPDAETLVWATAGELGVRAARR